MGHISLLSNLNGIIDITSYYCVILKIMILHDAIKTINNKVFLFSLKKEQNLVSCYKTKKTGFSQPCNKVTSTNAKVEYRTCKHIVAEGGVQPTFFCFFNHCYFNSSPNKLKICQTVKQLYIYNIMPKHENNALQKKIYNQFEKGTFSVSCLRPGLIDLNHDLN